MSYPVVEQIAQSIRTAVDAIAWASCVRPTRLGGYTPVDGLVVLEQDDPDPDDEGAPHAHKQWRQTFALSLFVVPSDTSTDPVDTTINTRRADIEKALRENAQWSGLAIDTRILAPQGFQADDGSFEGVAVMAEVTYRHLEDDPYTQ